FIQKDLSLNFNLNAPIQPDEVESSDYQTPAQKNASHKKKKNEAKLTEKSTPQKVAGVHKKSNSFFNFFDNPFGKSNPKVDLKINLDKVAEATKQGYLKRFAKVAVNEKDKFGVPASIILANALLHSQGGQHHLATSYNNHFAIPCGDDWNGGTGSENGICYRTYETAWMSFRNHSEYLTKGKFAHLSNLAANDYKGWARGLEKAGFSDSKNFAKNLVKVIEQYGLNDLDG
ncbi:MAG: glucosaminidase domain-containing protein, partial [Bacteroidota bacterium]